MPLEIKSLILDYVLMDTLAFKSSATVADTLEKPKNTPERQVSCITRAFPDLLEEILRILDRREPDTAKDCFVSGVPTIIPVTNSNDMQRASMLRLLVLIAIIARSMNCSATLENVAFFEK